MEDLEYSIGPGTAGIAQRIPAVDNKYNMKGSKEHLSIVEYNNVMPCGQNQY
ncbi:MAG: hypothetical protein AABX54_01225 [Nanoarchaeota archaeon]|mgnify:CR=1 FL=1